MPCYVMRNKVKRTLLVEWRVRAKNKQERCQKENKENKICPKKGQHWNQDEEKVAQTYRRAEIVSHFVSKGDMGDLWRHVRSIVLHRYNPGVQRLPLSIGIQLTLFTDTTGAPCRNSRQNAGQRTCNAAGKKTRLLNLD